MVAPSPLPQESCTPERIATWLIATQQTCLDLQLLFAEPWAVTLRDQAFRRMADLVQESLEEVRVLSDTLQANSEALRTRAAHLRKRSTMLGARSQRAREQYVLLQPGPSAEEIRAAEQPMLDMFKDSLRNAVCGPRTPGTRAKRAS